MLQQYGYEYLGEETLHKIICMECGAIRLPKPIY
jgi:ribosomal protein L40E